MNKIKFTINDNDPNKYFEINLLDKHIWINAQDGEGMSISYENLYGLLNTWFRENM